MKSVFFGLVLANVVAGAWLLLGTPVDVVREPGRVEMQVEPGRLRVLSEAEFARKREQAKAEAAAASEPPAAAGPSSAAPSPEPAATAGGTDMPVASCIEIGVFASDAATRKMRARLAAAGLAEHLSTSTTDKATRLQITGVDAAGEAQVQQILRDFPKQELSHCAQAPAAK